MQQMKQNNFWHIWRHNSKSSFQYKILILLNELNYSSDHELSNWKIK